VTPWLQQAIGSGGPYVLPTTYTVRLTAGDEVRTETVVVRPDPQDQLTPTERRERWTFLTRADDLQRASARTSMEIRDLINRAQAARQAAAASDRAPASLSRDLETLVGELNNLTRSGAGGGRRGGGGNFTGGFSASAARQGTIGKPTLDQQEALAAAVAASEALTGALAGLRADRIPALDRQLAAAGLPTIGGGA
jgi:hypothetical protein